MKEEKLSSIWEMILNLPNGAKEYAELQNLCKKHNISFSIETIVIRGSAENLKKLNEELKDVIPYEVDQKRSKKIC